MNDNTKSTILAFSPLLSLLTLGIPVLNIIAPLILWLVWKNGSARADAAGRNVLSSQISWTIWLLIAGAVFYGVWGTRFLWILGLLWAVFTVVQAIRIANRDDKYVMPLTIHFLH